MVRVKSLVFFFFEADIGKNPEITVTARQKFASLLMTRQQQEVVQPSGVQGKKIDSGR